MDSQKSTDSLIGLGSMRMRAAKEDGEKQIKGTTGHQAWESAGGRQQVHGVNQEALCALVMPETTLTLTPHDWSSAGTDDAWCLGWLWPH